MTSEVSNQLSPLRLGIKVICLVVSMAFGSGCAPFMPIPSPAAPADWSGESFHPGDRLRVFTHDGRTLDLVVTAVTGDALVGEPPYSRPGVGTFKVAFSEIARVERAEFDGAITAQATLAAVLGVLLVFAALIAATAN